jgi:glycosyltransferase involved in cell wall biosynthesis
LPEYLYQAPGSVLQAWWRCRRLPGYGSALRKFLKDLRRDFTPNRVRRFGQACVLAETLPPEQSWIHAHFLHTPASVARYAAIMTGRRWSASAHAKDIWTSPDWELAEKIIDAAWVVTCTESGAARLKSLATSADKVALLYHGLELEDLPKPPPRRPARDGRDPQDPCRIVSVGRLVEKKGYELLLEALARLPLDLHWRFTHIGGGALARELEAQAESLGLSGRITWLGPQAFERVVAEYRTADLFVLASRIAVDGDRDGLPNVLMEAQSQALACLATAVSAIPELIEDGVTGRLVAPDDGEVLAQGLAEMIGDPEKRLQLGAAGRRRLAEKFSALEGFKALAQRFPGRPSLKTEGG